MLKIYQDEFLPRENINPSIDNGNCFAACLASFLELPLKVIPRFQDLPKDSNWFLTFHQLLGSQEYILDGISYVTPPEGYCIASGPIAEGIGEHTCIYFNGKLFHDPNPNGKGLKSVSHYLIIKKIKKEEPKESPEIKLPEIEDSKNE